MYFFVFKQIIVVMSGLYHDLCSAKANPLTNSTIKILIYIYMYQSVQQYVLSLLDLCDLNVKVVAVNDAFLEFEMHRPPCVRVSCFYGNRGKIDANKLRDYMKRFHGGVLDGPMLF